MSMQRRAARIAWIVLVVVVSVAVAVIGLQPDAPAFPDPIDMLF